MFLENLSNYMDFLCLERGLSENTQEAYRNDLMEFIDFLAKNGIEKFKKDGYSIQVFYSWKCGHKTLLKHEILGLRLKKKNNLLFQEKDRATL